jgi:lycopene beta-cyclase
VHDVVVAGGGPAGWAVAARAVAHGLDVALVDPAPAPPWTATYGMWADELPAWLPADVVAARVEGPPAVARTAHVLPRSYLVLDPAALRGALRHPHVDVVEAPAAGRRPVEGGAAVLLPGGAAVPGRVVVDATGGRRALTALPAAGARAAQTAVGVVVPDDGRVAPAFMDWTADHGEDGWPTFLYAVPLGGGRLLLEETSLARRPGLPLDVLRRRLHVRLAARGIDVPPDAAEEHVRIPVDLPAARGSGAVVPIGVAAGQVHPATGYSLAASLGAADDVAVAIALALRGGRGTDAQRAAAAVRAARAAVWPPGARTVHRLRRRGLEVLLAMPPAEVPDFFELFFTLPAHHQRAYLSDRRDPAAAAAAMWALFTAADTRLRRRMVVAAPG